MLLLTQLIAMAKKQKFQLASVSTPNPAWFPLLAIAMAMMPQCASSKTTKVKKTKVRKTKVRVSSGEPTTQVLAASSSETAAGASSNEIVAVPLESEPSVSESSPSVSDPMEALLNTAFHEASHRTRADFVHLAPLPRYFDSFDSCCFLLKIM